MGGILLLIILLISNNQIHGGFSSKIGRRSKGKGRGCDLFRGGWVYDNSYPDLLYNNNNNVTENCPFIEKEFDCLLNGRPDKDHLKFRWQPSACDLPRFNGADFLRRLRGKRLMFVGDSLSLNQWQSLTCMLHLAVPQATYTLRRTGDLSIFTFPGYNASIMFLRNGFLVDIVTEKSGRVLKLDSIGTGTSWKGMDTLIFNSWHWWVHTGRKQPWDFIQEGKVIRKDTDRLALYEKALNTWARWVESELDPTHTKVFFQGVSPDHANGSDWGEANASCVGQTEPVKGQIYVGGEHPAELVLKKVLSRMSKPVYLLDITSLSQLRKDGHPSFYGLRGGHRIADCSHWCLPGLPDTWNQLLYAALISPRTRPN